MFLSSPRSRPNTYKRPVSFRRPFFRFFDFLSPWEGMTRQMTLPGDEKANPPQAPVTPPSAQPSAPTAPALKAGGDD